MNVSTYLPAEATPVIRLLDITRSIRHNLAGDGGSVDVVLG